MLASLPSLSWLARYRRGDLRADLLAGLTTGVVLVPQGMAYAMLAGLSPIVGLYASLASTFVYPWLGSSRQLSVGPVAIDSLLTASALGAVAALGSGDQAQAAALLAVLVGAVQAALAGLRAGFVVNFLSRPVISGFTSAAAIVIGSSQLPELVGIARPRADSLHELWWAVLTQVHNWHWPTLSLGLFALVTLRALPKVSTRVPAPLVVVALALLVSWGLGSTASGMKVVGEVPSGLPLLAWPTLRRDWLAALFPSALSIALISYTESITSGTAFARKHGYELAPNRELLALGAANVGSGLLGGYPVAGGLSRTAVNDRAGAHTPLASLVTSAMVALTLVLLTPVFRGLPRAALSAVVLAAVLGLVDLATPRTLYRVKRADFALLVLTFVATLVLGISQGVLGGIAASLLLFIVRSTRPHYAVLGNLAGTEAYLNVERHPHAVRVPGVLIVRMDAQLYFGNVSFLRETLRALEQKAHGSLRAVVLDASGVNQLDSSALEALEDLDRDYAARDVRLLFSRVKGPVRDVLQRAGMLARLRNERRIFTRTHDAAECARMYVEGKGAPCSLEGGDLSEGVDPGRG